MKFDQSKLRLWLRLVGQYGYRGWLAVQVWLWDTLLGAAAWVENALSPRRRLVAAGDLTRLRQDLKEESQLSWHYLVLVVGSCIIATLGLLSNSAAVIIGAMLIAPLMLPIRGAAFGILEADRPLIRTSLLALTVGSLLAVTISALLGALTGVAQFGSEVMGRTQPTLLDLGIAVTAGALAGVAKVEPKLSSTVAGTAIAVALMPPICVVGLWLGQGNLSLSLGALLLYLTNLFGITLACMVAFVLFGYSMVHRARRPLGITLIFTALLVVPLGASTLQLLQQNQLEASIRTALLDRTLTFQRVTLVDMDANWLTTPPDISLTVRSSEPISPKQVELLEQFLTKEMGRPYRLTFLVSQVEAITSSPPAANSDGQ
ncbi:DUF389 domain-containing protein [Nodosilinea nodulosa]|uniref:DUF389 domain-containing protein n=1 Tax=Nodosilinea nodulosa TaxID=416001 RepID=UPI0002F6B345|nr:DUF389 domain-containing protein [Nodosilinea nodulosa]